MIKNIEDFNLAWKLLQLDVEIPAVYPHLDDFYQETYFSL